MTGDAGRAAWQAMAKVVRPAAALLMAMGLLSAGLALLAGRAVAASAPPSRWGWPLAGAPAVARPFAPPSSDYGAGHRGVDLRAAAGDPVLAAGAGTVSYAGRLAGRGVIAVVHPGGLRTTYEPVTAAVPVGQPVARGDVLGRLSGGHASCRVGTDCLHWGLRRGDTYLDPMSLLGRSRLRLLPLGAMSADPSAGLPPSTVAADRGAGRPFAFMPTPPAAGVPPHSDPKGEPVGAAEPALAAAAAGSLAVVLALRAGRQRRRTR